MNSRYIHQVYTACQYNALETRSYTPYMAYQTNLQNKEFSLLLLKRSSHPVNFSKNRRFFEKLGVDLTY